MHVVHSLSTRDIPISYFTFTHFRNWLAKGQHGGTLVFSVGLLRPISPIFHAFGIALSIWLSPATQDGLLIIVNFVKSLRAPLFFKMLIMGD